MLVLWTARRHLEPYRAMLDRDGTPLSASWTVEIEPPPADQPSRRTAVEATWSFSGR